MRCGPGLALAWIVSLLGVVPLGGESRPPVTFAVLREDGILIPFATFDGKWKNPWPKPAVEAEVPITLADVPKAWWPGKRIQREWTLWTPDGGTRRLTAAAPAWVRAQCVSNVGLRSDFKSDTVLPDPETMPYPKAGLATSAGAEAVKVDPISVLDSSSPEWKQLLIDLPPVFLEAEMKTASQFDFTSFLPYVSGFMKGPIVIEALYRASDIVPGRLIYYFEATRRYAVTMARADSRTAGVTLKLTSPCDLVTFGSGWIREGQGRYEVYIRAVITDCQRQDVSFQHPLGVVRVHRGRPLWIVQWSSWQAEWYSVIDFANPIEPRPLFETWGGGCR